jgi:hypothetical protein
VHCQVVTGFPERLRSWGSRVRGDAELRKRKAAKLPSESRLGHHFPGRFSVVLPVYWHRSIRASRLRGQAAKGEVTEMKDGIAIMLGLLGVALAILIHGYLGRYQVTAGEQIVVRLDGLTGQACFYNYPDSKFERCTPTSD